MRDPRYDILFEPVQLGPVTARNRFFQVPHCNGMGHHRPDRARRDAGRQGGGRLGGRLHRGGRDPSLERCRALRRGAHLGRRRHPGARPAGRARCTSTVAGRDRAGARGHDRVEQLRRELADRPRPPRRCRAPIPVQARRMDRRDIADLRRWHRQAVGRSLRAGYDLVYVYAGARADRHPALPLAPLQRPHRRVRRQPRRTARGCCARSSRTRWRRWTAGPRSPAGSASTS